jgi:hypothetical protein
MSKHPYMDLKNTECWGIIEQAIGDLIENDDLEEKTSKEYIVGYIVQCVIKHYPTIK